MRRGVSHENPRWASHALIPVAPATVVIAAAAHCMHMSFSVKGGGATHDPGHREGRGSMRPAPLEITGRGTPPDPCPVMSLSYPAGPVPSTIPL